MRGDPILLTAPQRAVIETLIPDICQRGGWTYRICARADEQDHVHVLLDADPAIDPDAILKWLKRWLGEAAHPGTGKPTGNTWWAKAGSTRRSRTSHTSTATTTSADNARCRKPNKPAATRRAALLL
ncbi:MAG: hypothetical protein R3C45_08210 [Phycisphaerales bacterium]